MPNQYPEQISQANITNQYPEHDKLHAIKDESQACGEFIDWLRSQGMHLCYPHKHTKSCWERGTVEPPVDGKHRSYSLDEWHRKYTDETWIDCGTEEEKMLFVTTPVTKLLADFFGINLTKLEKEKEQMLDDIRKEHKTA
jgi:hypothetical protein